MADTITVNVGTFSLRSNFKGFDALASLHLRLAEIEGHEIAIECSTLSWIDGHLSAPLLTIVSHARARRNRVTLQNLPDDVQLILKKNRLLVAQADDSYHTTIPVQQFALDEEVTFADYTRKHLRRREMPKMTPALLGKLFEAIDELFANCALHSRSPVKVVATGQFFPRGERLAFAISDGGCGIDGSLRAAGIVKNSPEDAIDWAMGFKNTSRQGDIPGGLGLKLLRDFVELNKGSLLVASNAGLWQQSGARVEKTRMRNPFPGTSVILEINTNDNNVYDLKSSTDPRNIW